MSICKLCKREKKLIKSHIYPEWVYRSLYIDGKVDNNNQLILISTTENYVKRRPVGIWDPNILCESCDNYLGRIFDEKAKKYLMEIEPVIFKDDFNNSGKVYILPNVNPVIIKNFALSLLLRASWSKIEEYDHVKLEDKFVESLEGIVMENKDTGLHEFSVFLTKFSSRNPKLKEASEKYSQVPYPTLINGIFYWVINLPNAYKIYIKVDHKNNMELAPFFLRNDYPVYILEWEDFEESNELKMLKTHLDKIIKKD